MRPVCSRAHARSLPAAWPPLSAPMIARYGTAGARGASARRAGRVTRGEDVDRETCVALLRFALAVVRVETTVRTTYEREAGARGRAVGFKADREIDSPDTWIHRRRQQGMAVARGAAAGPGSPARGARGAHRDPERRR